MAFTFLPEDGTGLVGANSYVTLQEIKDYLGIVPSAADILALDDADLGQYAAWATRLLDQKTKWKGYKDCYPDGHVQGLAWPRTRAVDKYGFLLSSTVVPAQVKAATIELMRYIFAADPTTQQDVSNLKEVDVDVIKIIYQDGTAQTTYPPLLNQILEGLGYLEVGSAGFGRVVKA